MNIHSLYEAIKAKHPNIDSWDSVSVRLEFGSEGTDAVAASILCGASSEPWESFRAFEKVAVVINNRQVIPDILQDLQPKEIAYAAFMLKYYWPKEQFNDEVTKYMASVLDECGFVVAPAQLTFVQPFLKLLKLSPEQAAIQKTYLQEVDDYCGLMKGADIGGGSK